MKLKLTLLVVSGFVAMGLMAGTSVAQEMEVIIESNPATGGDNATGIRNLTVGSDLYDVIFVLAPALVVYPGDPPDWDFPTEDSAGQAVDAAADALNTEPSVTAVGPPGTGQGGFFAIGYETVISGGGATQVAIRSAGWGPLDGWYLTEDGSLVPPNQTQIYAKFLPTDSLPPDADEGVLERPTNGSDQSGVGVVSGWHCSASVIEISFDGGARILAGSGTTREDTVGICGDSDNGFSLLWSYSLFSDGEHEAVAYADGVEFGRATFSTTRLNGEEFVTGVSGQWTLSDWPEPGNTQIIKWDEASQGWILIESNP